MIVKSCVYNFESDKPVPLNNTIYIPAENDETDNAANAAELKKREEQQRRDAEEKRIQKAVEDRVRVALEQSRAQSDAYANDIIAQAQAKANALTADAKAATKTVLEKAAVESAAMKEQAKKDGYKEGFDKGSAEAKVKCEKYVEAAAKFIAEINSSKETYYISHEALLREAVFEMVKKITLAELDRDDKMIERIIVNAAKQFRNSDYIKISLLEGEVSKEFTSDAEFINKLIAFIPEIEVEYLNPGEAEKGTVILDNDKEIIDASVPTQLEFLREIIKNTRGEQKQ